MAQPIQAEQLQEVVSCEADSVAGQQYRDCSMYYVYLIQSINTPEQKYIGFTETSYHLFLSSTLICIETFSFFKLFNACSNL